MENQSDTATKGDAAVEGTTGNRRATTGDTLSEGKDTTGKDQDALEALLIETRLQKLIGSFKKENVNLEVLCFPRIHVNRKSCRHAPSSFFKKMFLYSLRNHNRRIFFLLGKHSREHVRSSPWRRGTLYGLDGGLKLGWRQCEARVRWAAMIVSFRCHRVQSWRRKWTGQGLERIFWMLCLPASSPLPLPLVISYTSRFTQILIYHATNQTEGDRKWRERRS